jgi:hypothetical protein
LADLATAAAAAEALRGLIDAILVFPGERRGKHCLIIAVALSSLLRLSRDRIDKGADHLVSALGVQVKGDAGTGFEPVTFRL